MAEVEIAALREELNDITWRIKLLKETVSIKEEVELIKKGVEEIAKAHQEKKGGEKRELEQKETHAREERERAALKAAQEKKEREEKERAERDRKAAEEREKREREVRREKEEQERKEKEKREVEARSKAEKEQKERDEKERKQREEKEKKEREEKEKKQREELQKKQQTQQSTTNAPIVTNHSVDKYEAERKKTLDAERDALFNAKHKAVEKPDFIQLGMDKELSQRSKEKYDPKLENEAKEWIETVTGEKFSGSFADSLKNGITLCNLANKIKPNIVKKINKMKMSFAMMENINAFLTAAKELGVPAEDLFQTVDLFEEKNMNQVIFTIHSLGRVCRRIPGYNGPALGAKLADKHAVQFTEEQLKKGQAELNYSQRVQADTQKVVSEARKPALDSVIKTQNTGTTTTELGLLDKPKTAAQKEVSAARKQGHNIIK